jgi:hypothetical protein
MTYPNDPRRVPESDGGMSAGAMAGIAVAVLLFLGVIIWAFNSGDQQTTTSGSPPATTGQRSPAPAPTPAPPPKAQ